MSIFKGEAMSKNKKGCEMHWRTILAVDQDANAAATYRANFPGVDVRCASVESVLQELPQCDVLLAGFPCQPHGR